MIISMKFWVSVVISVSFLWSFAQEPAKTVSPGSGILYDVFGKLYLENIPDNEAIRRYYTSKGDTLVASRARTVEFIGGRDSLRAYISHYYYQHRNPENDELNVMITLRVILDSNLQVIESRILQRGYNPGKYPTLDSVFLAIMNSTSGHWRKIDDSDTSKYHTSGMMYRIY